jgi:hypothetical protein
MWITDFHNHVDVSKVINASPRISQAYPGRAFKDLGTKIYSDDRVCLTC